MVELYINNRLMQLDKSVKVAVTRQINDFGELKDRQATFTNSFVIPISANNNFYLNIVGNQSRLPYQKVNVRLVYDGVTIIPDGYGIIQKTDFKKNVYKLTIYRGVVTFFDKLGNLKISDLDLSAINHDLNNTNFINSFSNTWQDGYIYGISDFGNTKESKIEINYQMPSLFVRYLWNRIFDLTGFDKDFEPDDDLVITANRGWQSVIETLESWSENGNAIENCNDTCEGDDTDCTIPVGSSDYANGFYFKELRFNFDTNSQHVNTQRQIQLTNTQRYQNHFDFTLEINGYRLFSILITAKDSNGQSTIVDEIYRTDAGITETHNQNGNNNYDYTYDIDVTREWQLNSGDTLIFEAKMESINYENYRGCQGVDVYDNPFYETYPYGIYYHSGNDTFQTLNNNVSQVNFTTLIGDIKLSDFIKDIMHHYALMVKVEGNTVKFIKAKDMLNMNNSVDWSDYFIEQVDEDYLLKGYAQENLMTYNYNKDAVDNFADDKFYLDNKTLAKEKVVLKRLYNASEKSDVSINGDLLQFTQFWKAKRDDSGNVTGYKPFKDKSYLCRVKTKNGTINYGTHYGQTQTYTGDYPILTFDDLNWDYLKNEYYKEIISMLNWYRKVHIKIRINSLMFNEMDMFKLVYFKQLGGYFYVNRLKYKGEKTAVGEFIFVNL